MVLVQGLELLLQRFDLPLVLLLESKNLLFALLRDSLHFAIALFRSRCDLFLTGVCE